jgi:hypothetical protein
MAILVDHQPITLPVGRQVVGPQPIPGGSSFVIRLARQTTATPGFWPASVTINELLIESSANGGATWGVSCGGTVIVGGIALTRGGVEVTESVWRCGFASNATHVRLTLDIGGGPLVSQVTVETN